MNVTGFPFADAKLPKLVGDLVIQGYQFEICLRTGDFKNFSCILYQPLLGLIPLLKLANSEQFPSNKCWIFLAGEVEFYWKVEKS